MPLQDLLPHACLEVSLEPSWLIALCLAVLDGSSPKIIIQLHCFECCYTCLIVSGVLAQPKVNMDLRPSLNLHRLCQDMCEIIPITCHSEGHQQNFLFGACERIHSFSKFLKNLSVIPMSMNEWDTKPLLIQCLSHFYITYPLYENEGLKSYSSTTPVSGVEKHSYGSMFIRSSIDL